MHRDFKTVTVHKDVLITNSKDFYNAGAVTYVKDVEKN